MDPPKDRQTQSPDKHLVLSEVKRMFSPVGRVGGSRWWLTLAARSPPTACAVYIFRGDLLSVWEGHVVRTWPADRTIVRAKPGLCRGFGGNPASLRGLGRGPTQPSPGLFFPLPLPLCFGEI